MIDKQAVLSHREEILTIARRHGAYDVRIFGSVARGDQREDSDLDFIVRFEAGRSLFDHGALINDLEDLLGTKVDVVSEKGMRERFRDYVEKEAIAI